jgi:hypothetical protein
VKTDLDISVATSSEVNAVIAADLIPPLMEKYSNLLISSGGEQRERRMRKRR